MELHFRPPFDASGLLTFLGRRAVRGVEEVEEDIYRRTLRLAHGPAVVELQIGAEAQHMRLTGADPRDEADAVARCRALLDLDADPVAIDAVLSADSVLRKAVGERPGLRVPGTVDPFELAVRAVLGQQVSVAAARKLAERVVDGCGPRLAAPAGGLARLFPGPDDLLNADPAIFAMPAARREALLALARAWPCADRAALLAVPGIGPWTADYVAMRCGDRDVLLENDSALRAAIRRQPGLVDPDRWRPYRSYGVLHLWDLAATRG